MKTVLLVLSLLISGIPASADTPRLTLQQHMQAVREILADVSTHSEDPLQYAHAAERTRTLRSHLVLAIGYKPPQVEPMPENERRLAMIEFHQQMARLVYLSCTLEQAFDGGEDYQSESSSRRQDIRHLIREVSVLLRRR